MIAQVDGTDGRASGCDSKFVDLFLPMTMAKEHADEACCSLKVQVDLDYEIGFRCFFGRSPLLPCFAPLPPPPLRAPSPPLPSSSTYFPMLHCQSITLPCRRSTHRPRPAARLPPPLLLLRPTARRFLLGIVSFCSEPIQTSAFLRQART